MTDIEGLRVEVLEHLQRAKGGRPLDRVSADGLLTLFNKIAPHRAIDPKEYGGDSAREELPGEPERPSDEEPVDGDQT